MLRHQQKSRQLLKRVLPSTQQERLIHQQNAIVCNKSSNVFRQGKIMGKLFGHRVSGSKKRWFPSATVADSNIIFKQLQSGKTPNGGGKNVTRRMTVLNKLFMKHITDLLATGEISESILGKGLQVSRVKISPDFAYVNVFWVSSGEMDKDANLELELQRCSGLLRHELSQLGLMGVVPRIKFVKDKIFANMIAVEHLLKNMDFGTDVEEQQEEIDFQTKHKAENLKQEFYGSRANDISAIKQNYFKENDQLVKTLDDKVPEMRHDVLGLDHKGIMLKIFTKLRKSKQAWDQHMQKTSSELDNSTSKNSVTIPSTTFVQLTRTNEKLAKAAADSEKFNDFLAKRREKRNTPERKKFVLSDHNIDEVNQHEQSKSILSKSHRELFEAEDYLLDEVENENEK